MKLLGIIALTFVGAVSKAQLPEPHFRAFNKSFAVIINNESKGKSHLWPVYSEREMNTRVGYLSPGDTVKVTGWSTWTYFIEASTIKKGYVSWKALTPSRDAELIVRMIEEQSKKDDELDKRSIPLTPDAILNFFTDKSHVLVGQCFNIGLEICVADENRVPMRFYKLGLEVANIYTNKLNFFDASISRNFVGDVSGVKKIINGKNYTSYRIINSYVCPTKLRDLQIPEIELHMEQTNFGRTFDKLVSFRSKPNTIRVNSIPHQDAADENQLELVCEHVEFMDSLYIENQQRELTGKYKLEVKTHGYLPLFDHPRISLPNDSKSKMISFSEKDTLINGQLVSSRMFMYELKFTKPGTYGLSDNALLKYFNPVESKYKYLRSNKTINIDDSMIKSSLTIDDFLKENLILIDISKSMKIIEDYHPTRLEASLNGIRAFLAIRKKCDIDLIVFGAGARIVKTSTPELCYADSRIDSIKFQTERRGTSISDAILLAVGSINATSNKKRIVIIGDGDNTAGDLKPEVVALKAKKLGIKIFTIGVGTTGLVSIGKDETGKVRRVDSTFYDEIFKQISALTGGEYFWAKDDKEIARFLKKILG